MDLTLLRAPDPAIRTRLDAAIDAFNDVATGRTEPARHLTIALRDAAGVVEGGLVGISYYDWLLVQMLFVPEARRGQGLGAQLMLAAEAEAVRRGCRGVWLDTGSPAARGFYERIGYGVFATLNDYPRGHTKWFHARLAPRYGDTAGLEIIEARDPAVARVVGAALTAVADDLFGAETGREALAVTAPQGGGLWMLARRDWLFLDLFVLPAEARRQGLGSRILAMAEAAARARGCVGVWLDTYGFQARPFYERHGYRVIGALPDFPAPWQRFFLAKRF
ncbi:MAG: GNAT family N-acetyltransferase [Alphaproteobacteria bacterium]|nr:GNAT family N-acetyltransferase [Alphaproteobacteria bacterium]